MALLAGVDIVIELPLLYVLGGADFFARGAVALLAATGMVDCLSFGSELGDINMIKEGGRILAEEPLIYKEALRKALNAGNNFAAARGAALEALGFSHIIAQPNNNLGMEYCKALQLLGNPMEAYTTHRKPNGASAARIRKNIDEYIDSMPLYAQDILLEAIKKGETVRMNDFSGMLRLLFCQKNAPILEEGLHNRFKKYAMRHTLLSDILLHVKTKRYTLTRLQRLAICILLGISPVYTPPAYIRVLGFRKESSQLLGDMTRRAQLPVLTHGAALDAFSHSMLDKELEAGDIYQLAYKNGFTKNERGMEIIRV
jgi:predicted nucleotidyltransferase